MSSKYWIKLYHEILDDPKMGMMPDILFGRCMKFFLIAGDFEKDGELPPIEHIAWRLRYSSKEIESDLIELQKLGITMSKDGTWRIKNWKKRQGPMDEAERSRRRRADQYRREYAEYGPACMGASTPSRPDTDRNRDHLTVGEVEEIIDIDVDKESENFAKFEFLKYFEEITTIPEPSPKTKPGRKERDEWWEAATEALSMAGGDLEKAKYLAKHAFEHCKEQELTLVGPKSLLKTMRSVAGGLTKGIPRSKDQEFVEELRKKQDV